MVFIPTQYIKQMNIQVNQISKNQRNFKNLRIIWKKNFHKQEREREYVCVCVCVRERERERERERDVFDTYSLMLRHFEKLCKNLLDLTNF